MDLYSLKQENRRKFHEKEKLKRKHATPSDRKHRILNKLSQEDNIPSSEDGQSDNNEHIPDEPVHSNEHRYMDVLCDSEENISQINSINSKLKQLLIQRSKETTISEADIMKNYKRAELEKMDVSALNEILSKGNVINSTTSKQTVDTSTKPSSMVTSHNTHIVNDIKIPGKSAHPPKNHHSTIPSSLNEDETFLDSII